MAKKQILGSFFFCCKENNEEASCIRNANAQKVACHRVPAHIFDLKMVLRHDFSAAKCEQGCDHSQFGFANEDGHPLEFVAWAQSGMLVWPVFTNH